MRDNNTFQPPPFIRVVLYLLTLLGGYFKTLTDLRLNRAFHT